MPPAKKAAYVPSLLWVFLLPIPLLWALLAHFGQLRWLENQSVDLRFQYRGEIAAPVKLMYVDLDTRAIEAIGEKPWNRAVFAQVIDALLEQGGAKAIGVDMVFSRISGSKLVDQTKAARGNSEFRKALLKHPASVVLAAQYTQGSSILGQEPGALRQLPLLRLGRVDAAQNDVPEMPDAGFVTDFSGAPLGRVGLIDVDVGYSGDSVPRWVPAFVPTARLTVYHLSLQLVLQSLGLPETAVRVHPDRIEAVDAAGAVKLSAPLREGQLVAVNWFSHWENETLNPRYSLADVVAEILNLHSEQETVVQEAKAFFREFENAIVLIGPTDPLLQDLAPTPFDAHPVPKVGVHGNLVKTMLSGRYLSHPPRWFTWAAVFALTALVSGLAVRGGSRGLTAKALAVGLMAGYAYAALWLFSHSDLVLPMAAPIGSAFTTSFAAVMWQLISEEKAKSRIKGMFGTYLAPTVVERMIESGKDPELGGHDAEITAYFSDIQNFSSFSEVLPSSKLGELLNEYLTACTDIVQAEMGTLDKYIGDAVVAMFGAPLDAPDHAYRACIASQLVQLRIGELREKWRREGDKWPQLVHNLRTRIGLNTGVCMIGNMGSRTRFNYTMMGDNVNLAARMESGAKSWGAYTMCAEATRQACLQRGDAVVFRRLGRIVVKGRTQAVPISEIVGLKQNVTDQTRECVAVFEQALERYYARDWDGALSLLARSARLEPNQPDPRAGIASNPSLIYLDIVTDAKAEPPPAEWDGRYVMKEK